MKLQISAAFDSGNIEVVSASDPSDIRLNIRKDAHSDFYQWFFFRLSGARGAACTLRLLNAAGAAYPGGWDNYRACVSTDLENWTRIPTRRDGDALVIDHTPHHDLVWFAYFAPYTSERHARLLARTQTSPLARMSSLGQTLDGRSLDMITVGTPGEGRRNLWVIARQHPGETMAQWWVEGFLNRLLDTSDEEATRLRAGAVIHIVPNMNPDGSARGHLRTNAAGANLNREWSAPSLARSPEVFHTLAGMRETGVDFALDVHGDETLPYNFIAGSQGIPGYGDRLRGLLDRFLSAYLAASPDFQTRHGYPVNAPGTGNLSMAGNFLAHTFDCLAMTLEMPFKDDADRPDPVEGWSPSRAMALGRAAVEPMLAVLPHLREG